MCSGIVAQMANKLSAISAMRADSFLNSRCDLTGLRLMITQLVNIGPQKVLRQTAKCYISAHSRNR